MDIKDFILIAGGTLIALVLAHGFWIAYRARRETLRMDIVPDLIPGADEDDLERLRGELPNGGARSRSVGRDVQSYAASQQALGLDVPVLEPEAQESSAPLFFSQQDTEQSPATQRGQAELDLSATRTKTQPTARATVREVELPPESGQEQDLFTDPQPADSRAEPTVTSGAGRHRRDPQPQQSSQRRPVRQTRRQPAEEAEAPSLSSSVEELLVINLIAPRNAPFQGNDLVNALRAQGLRYGDMSIFHRITPTTKAKLFSVANIVEPGTFDLADLDTMSSPGMSFFLQLPGPDHALDAFEDMVTTARNISTQLGGEVRDESLNLLTRQTEQHMRQRISDFARRRLSMRA